MREVELKAVLDSWDERRRHLERAGAVRTFAGRLEDRRLDDATRSLTARDIVLRLRVYRDEGGARAELNYKGPTEYAHGFKVRDEIGSSVTDADALAVIFEGLGYLVIRAIDREIEQFELAEVVIRFERYPRMDDLVEVEGEPDAIEHAVAALGMARTSFTSERLTDFVARYEARTGARAAVSDADLSLPAHLAIEG